MRQRYVVRRTDRAHRGSIMVLNIRTGKLVCVPQGRPVQLTDRVVRLLRSAREYVYSDETGWERSMRHIYSVRASSATGG